ncbi:hypothetical protein [Streptomyces sp. 5-10]|uniref:hypothetical protein n=1 Tax=Streptomyces sp. 5-10 TaxID=878925 RepID=UPI00168AAEAE|nr:hypothetical protein [Streptomyces sp. 5-10]MBD3004681.1 hypothetical protein [Streptomyces sp. 5-10]
MYDTKLPKWPRLMVRGRNIRPEQADQVILRTTWFGGLTCNDEKWNKTVRRIFGITAQEHGAGWFDQWSQVAVDLDALDLQYVYNDQISSSSADGPKGWVSWGGQVFGDGVTLLGKWPTVAEVTDDWRKIAHAFPYLELTAQLVAEEWDEGFEHLESYRPLVSWTVGRGGVELNSTPGDPMFEPPGGTREEQLDRKYAKGLPSERGVSEKRLRAAVERCRRRAKQGR